MRVVDPPHTSTCVRSQVSCEGTMDICRRRSWCEQQCKPERLAAWMRAAGARVTSFTGTQVHMLTQKRTRAAAPSVGGALLACEDAAAAAAASSAAAATGVRFTCFTGTRVQILTQTALLGGDARGGYRGAEVQILTRQKALLVQKHKC